MRFVASLAFALSCLTLCAAFAQETAQEIQDGQFAVQSNLRAGAAKVDITPEETEGVLVTGHRRTVHGVRDPLRAGVLVLDDGETKAAIVTLDTIGAWDEMVALARQRIEQETGVPAAHILVAASHNHSGPGFDADRQVGPRTDRQAGRRRQAGRVDECAR